MSILKKKTFMSSEDIQSMPFKEAVIAAGKNCNCAIILFDENGRVIMCGDPAGDSEENRYVCATHKKGVKIDEELLKKQMNRRIIPLPIVCLSNLWEVANMCCRVLRGSLKAGAKSIICTY